MKIFDENKGIALLFSLGALAVLLAMGLSFVMFVRLEQKAAGNRLDHVKCGLVMRAGIEHALAVLMAQRDQGFDCFGSRWRTDFEGAEWDNSGDGNADSSWICLEGPGGEIIGRYSVLVEDESGKLNINHSGNLSVELSENSRAHGRNEGWSVFEISVADVLFSLGFSNPAALAEKIVRERFGGYPDAGCPGFFPGLYSDGIDTDGGGGASACPFGFSPWKPAARLAHEPFVELTRVSLVDGDLGRGLEELSGHLTVHSRSPNKYVEGGAWRRRVNINAFEEPAALYESLAGAGISDAKACRLAVNILDYMDENIWISKFESPEDGNIYFGVESVLINEVLANSYKADTETRTNASGGPMTFVYSGLAPATAYRMSVLLWYHSNPANVRFRVNAGTWQNADSGGSSVLARSFRYHDINNSVSDSSGNITICVDYDRTRAGEDLPFTGAVSISGVHFVAAEFIELLNVGGEEVELDGWEIEVVSGGSSSVNPVPASLIQPGDYLVLTNDLELFEISYGPVNAVEISGWESGYSTGISQWGEFDDEGDIEIYLYTDRNMGLLADLVLDGRDKNMPGMAPPGASPGIGVSREKRDPALRTFWMGNYDGRATPGADNSVIPESRRDVLPGIRSGDFPPLVKNGPFATTGEIIETPGWRCGETIKYPGIRAGSGVWASVSPAVLGEIAGRITASPLIRMGSGTAVISDSFHTWPARLDRNSGMGRYRIFLRGDYSGDEEDIVLWGNAGYAFGESGWADLGLVRADALGPDGSLSLGLSGEFEFVALCPGSVHGKININTASHAVLTGLPAVCSDSASSIISGRNEAPFESTGELLSREVLSPARFAPAANLVTAGSDVFKIVCTARIPHPSSPADRELFASERAAEVIVDRSGGEIKIISWKEIHR